MEANYKNKGMILLKKGQKGIIHAIFSRFGLILLLLVVQVFILFGIFRWFEEFLPHILGGTTLFTFAIVVYLLNSRIDPTAKVTWLIVIMLLPVFGVLLFLYIQNNIGHRALKKKMGDMIRDTKGCIPQSEEVMEHLSGENEGVASLARYMQRSGCHTVYEKTDVAYFPLGEDMFQEMLRQLAQARHFIFMEYFIVDEGLMWGQILEILAQKAAEGVEVRVMYDGACEFALLPHDYPKRLKVLGIKCKAFAPVTPFISTHYNYRDHRKILVIDGHTAFTGGINLADEYVNHKNKFGHWKDTAVMLKGEAVRSFTLMFLQMWGIDEKGLDCGQYLSFPVQPAEDAGGDVIPYGDCPLDDDRVGERVYMDMLNRSVKCVHIMTPYLILDGEMETALKFAAERGVEVVLVLPGIPDKRIPYALAKTHYASLIESGVKIYEYTPGFVHAKVFVSDAREAVVGTINLDYRSLYHHFECAAYFYGTGCIAGIEADFGSVLEKCRQVTMETVRSEKCLVRLTGCLMKAAAPLM
ncbi:cardiolipin synthase [Parablautia intestinalis]|uniref:cardiolipin synthase n=1 Tax=Parablautia intestinalis TaxID=2320100 RepID=UPI00259CA394|nr:cardiolipin synthase [Parablautia intestinalis]